MEILAYPVEAVAHRGVLCLVFDFLLAVEPVIRLEEIPQIAVIAVIPVGVSVIVRAPCRLLRDGDALGKGIPTKGSCHALVVVKDDADILPRG